MAERGLAQPGDDLEQRALATAGGPENGGKMFLGETQRQIRKQKLIVGGVAQLEGDFLEFEHGGESVVD